MKNNINKINKDNEATKIQNEQSNLYIPDAKTDRTRKNIYKELLFRLNEVYGKPECTNAILKIHGVDARRFDFISNVENFMLQKLNDISVDDNSNKNETTLEGIFQESVIPIRKIVGYDILYREMKHLYGKEEAKRLSRSMYDYSLALHDASKSERIYCYALNASPIVVEGRKFGQLHSKPCKHIQSYISALCETIHQLSNHVAGALAVPTFFMDCCHVLLKDGYDLDSLKKPKTRKKIENEFQQFVHSVNHLSRSSSESPFSNLSIYDKYKLKNIVKEMDWYFSSFDKDTEYLVDYIMELQRIFLDFFDKGDELRGGLQLRFPVVTVSLSTHKNKIMDEEFLDEFCNNYDVYRYNIFASEGTKVSSCCRLQSNTEMMELASQSNSFGGVGVSLGSHRVVTINMPRMALMPLSYKEFYTNLYNYIEDTAKILKAHKSLLYKLTDAGLQPFIKNGYLPLARTFSTFGIIGIAECKEILENRFGKIESDDVIKDILEFFNITVLEMGKKYEIIPNIEQIPGESMAIRLADTDRMLFGKELVPYKMYSNQFVPLWEDATIYDRLSTDGRYNSLLTGGGISHLMVGEKVTPEQAKKLIRFSVSCNCEHFALNLVYSQCENNHVTHGKFKDCPTCGGKIVDYYTRVVGYIVSVKNWSKVRREWEFDNRKFVDVKDI